MEKLSKMGSFESFQLSKQAMNQVTGARTKEWAETTGGDCAKIIDDNDGIVTKIKVKERYEGNC